VCVEHIDDGPANDLTWSDGVYEGIPVRRLSFDLRRAPDRFRWEYDNPWVHRHLRAVIEEQRPDVFILIGGYLLSGAALAAAREAHLPSIVRLMDFWFLCPRIIMLRSDGRLSPPPIDPVTCARCLGEEKRRYRIPGRVAPGLMKLFWRLRWTQAGRVRARLEFLLRCLQQADAVISTSQFLRHVYTSAGLDPAHIHFARQGIELPEAAPEPLPFPPLRIGYLGQIAPLKGVDVLLRAVRSLPGEPLEVHVYGDLDPFPEYSRSLRALAAGDPRIQLLGRYQERGGLLEALRPLHAVVVPSLWYENSPNVILESFAHGLPVLASNLGGMAELVRHEESGLLFQPGDAMDLASQIRRLLREPSLLPVLRSGIPPVKSSAEEVDEVESWCERVVARHRAVGALR